MLSKLMYVVGTRPEVIRSAKIIHHLDSILGRSNVVLLNTGQHYDYGMMGQFFRQLDVRYPDVTFDAVYHTDVAAVAGIMHQVAEEIRERKCTHVAVYGDTNSSLAAALAAAKARIPVVHIEAGCRSFDLRMQEELNRRLIDHLSDVCLAVSEVCRQNLERERVPGTIEVIGDPQFDIFSETAGKFLFDSDSSDRDPVDEIGLVTLHRAENVDDESRLVGILSSLSSVSQKSGIEWIFPVHPRTRRNMTSIRLPGLKLVDPLSYEDLLRVLRMAKVCVTDSGGLQKEAYWMQVRCVTIRPSTEWIETLTEERNLLVDNPETLASILLDVLNRGVPVRKVNNPYGPLGASERAATHISDWLMQFG